MSANGDSTATVPSSGGAVTIQSGGSFSDQSGSTISVAGAAQGGNGGQVTISAPQMTALNSSISGPASAGYADAGLSIDTAAISLNADGSPVAGALSLNVNSWSSGYSQINLQAANSIELSSQWILGNPATVSLLAGSTITVDSTATIEANAGKIDLSAPTVNQNGTLQANSIGNANGVVEIDAGASLSLGASSVISANGDATAAGASPGGFVVLNAGNNTFADTSGSTISVAGAVGGQNGIIEIFGNGVTAGAIQSSYGSPYALLINPYDLSLSSGATVIAANPTLNLGALSSYSQIDLQALDNITLGSAWTLGSQTTPTTLSLSAGNNVTLNGSLSAGNNWNVNLTAGTGFVPTTAQPTPSAGNDGIYLNGGSLIQSLNGDITLDAANEVIVNSGAIRTVGGGNIDVTAQYGNVNTGTGANGFNYLTSAPYYTPASSLGGISTAAGGNVTINAGNNVISFPTTTVAGGDPGTGAFGPEAGNVTINAGGSVYGCYVVMNGTGTINAGQNIGTGPTPGNPNAVNQNVALSLAKGSWNLDAQGNIFLQEVRNPNGVFDNKTTISGKATAGNHLFDYSPNASVSLTAGNGVYITGYELPRPNGAVPVLLPPTVIINAGLGGVTLQTPTATDGTQNNDITLSDYDITLFPSAYGNLQITTTDGGGLSSENGNGSPATLLMSDSGQTHWFISNSGTQPFSETDHASVPAEMNNPTPAALNISGSMENIILQLSQFAQIIIGGDMIGCTFFGENLQANQATSITVGGQIYNAGSFNFVTLSEAFPSLPVADLPPGTIDNWYSILQLAVDPTRLPTESLLGVSQAQLAADINNAALFPGINISGNLVYDPSSQTLTAIGPLSPTLLQALESPTLTVVRYGQNGLPLLDSNGHLVTDTITWTPASSANYADINNLNTTSQGATSLTSNAGGYIVGGTGTFDVTANSISLGNSDGILSVGDGPILGRDYSFLAPYITSGATINVTADYLEMPSSVIAALGGGSVNVTCTGEIPGSPQNSQGVGVSMDLGSQELGPFTSSIINNNGQIGLGIYNTGVGSVNVTALGTIDVDSSCIAAFDGGSITVISETGDVNAGTGGTTVVPVNYYAPDYFGANPLEFVPANGIVAGTLTAGRQIPPGTPLLPGDITVSTPQGSIYANAGGISQVAYNQILSAAAGSVAITLTAGSDGYIGDIVLGDSGVIGVNVNANATGKITGLIISQQNADINAGQSFAGTVLSGGKTTLSTPGTISGTIVAAGGVNTSGGGNLAATVLTTSVNGGAGTLATSSSASSTGQSAAGQTSSQNQQQVASNDNGTDDDKNKKKTGLARTVGRVTVILPKAS